MPKILSASNESRVWTKSFLAENTFLGPYKGDVAHLIEAVQFLHTPSTQFKTSDKRNFTEHDLSLGDNSWMSDVNPARSEKEQNMEAIRTPDDDKIYFRTTRDILSGEELRVWLAPFLEEEHELQSIEKKGFEDTQWTCPNCGKDFQYSRALSAHVTYSCGELGSSIASWKAKTRKAADSDDNDILVTKNSSNQSKVTESQYQDERVRTKQCTDERSHPNVDKSERCSTDEPTPMITEQTSASFVHSRVLSNSRLESLISSFTPPRLRKFSNQPQSLAEYHKQEFRKKFQGNEQYLRRHLYRENMERKYSSNKHRRAFVMNEDDEYSLKSDEHTLRIKEEKDEFINCFQGDYILDLQKSNTFFPSLPESEIFRSGIGKSTSKYHFQDEHSPLNASAFKSYSNFMSSMGPRGTLINNVFPTPEGNEGLQCVDEEHLSREADHECTCQNHNDTRDFSKQGKSSMENEEMRSTEGNQENSATHSEELDQRIHRSNHQRSGVGSMVNFSRFGSYFVYQRMQPSEDMSLRQRLQCHCYSSPLLREPTENAAPRFHEPAFVVDQMYRYSTYPRMLPFFAHHPNNSPQASQRNQGFTCDYCGKVYCRKYVLKIHMRTHTGFKPLRCKVCDKSFSDPSNMKKHVKLHETEDTVHKCRYCGRNFVRYRGLLNHIKSKHSEHVHVSL